MITRLAISGYRSLREIRLDVGALTVVTGANGSGKSSLYRALRLLADIAQGRVIQSLATEGGLESTLWAGPDQFSRSMKSGEHPVQGTVRRKPIALQLGFTDESFGYAVDLGLPVPGSSMFSRDPEIKAESLWIGERLSPRNVIAERRGPSVRLRAESGSWRQASTSLSPRDSMMTHCAGSSDAVEVLHLRERMRNWRFYDHFRTDRDAPARQPQIATYTPVLSSDGGDLAAAIQTVIEIGERDRLDETIADAFDGASVEIAGEGAMTLSMRQYGLLRPLAASELSDGTLRYLLLVAALLTPRPPELMILNEPESSLHSDLLAPLALDRDSGTRHTNRRRLAREAARRGIRRTGGRYTDRAGQTARRNADRRH